MSLVKVAFILLLICSTFAVPLRVSALEAPFSANDLAILFPLNAQDHLPIQKVTLATPGWKLISLGNFQRVLKAAEENGIYLNDKLKNPENWYLVALRYAPCSMFMGRSPLCTEQIRFIMQPYKTTRTGGFDDYAMHIVFNFAQGESPITTSRLESFRNLKNRFGAPLLDQSLKPNGILSSNQGPAYFQSLQQEVIEKHINDRTASLVTFMGTAKDGDQNDQDHWLFFVGSMDSKGRWSLNTLPTGQSVMAESFQVNGESGENQFNIAPIKDQDNLIKGSGDQMTEAAIRILNARTNNDHNTDCASCHLADRFVFPPLFDSSDEGKKLFLRQMVQMTAGKARLTEVVANKEFHSGSFPSEAPVLRNFGYLDGNVLISQRLVNDNSLSVEQANKLLGLKVTSQCPKEIERRAFFECLYFNGDQSSQSSCLQKVCGDSNF